MQQKVDHRLWPGKTLGLGKREADLNWHPATFHSLDVAAVALELVRRKPRWLSRLGASVGIDGEQLGFVFVRLIALHDIGKLSQRFCELLEHPLPVGKGCNSVPSSLRHWQISYQLLLGPLDNAAEKLISVESIFARLELYAAVAGHHGEPPERERRFRDKIGVPAALAFIEELDQLLPHCKDINLTENQAKKLSWSLAGLTVASDWIGSNEEWFPYTSSEMETEHYWETTKIAAVRAVDYSHIGGACVADAKTFIELFDIGTPRPMQQAAVGVALPKSPTLFIMEDTTGSGKTEAAVMLAHRMMCNGLGEGVYIALPTMATANAMYARMGKSYRQLFKVSPGDSPELSSVPSLALAHGHRHLDPAFREAVGASLMQQQIDEKTSSSEGSSDAMAFCAGWIADNKRKTFLAEVGVGTMDQAFLSVLPVRHAVLRLFGLGQRILIVDEAHACDPYMQAELCQLLQMQAALGGSAIVMTATLTINLREKLARSYQSGLTDTPNDCDMDGNYPLLTMVTKEKIQSKRVEAIELGKRQLPVRRVASVEEAAALVVEAANKGAAVAWIRNTVDDAIAAFDAVRQHSGDVQIFHARFALYDRLAIERKVVSQFGPEANANDRRGKILIATQVIEQSLDLDFDFLVTDLAPIDALIQRAGRLWRHMDIRPANGRPVPSAILHVLSADPNDVSDSHWGQAQTGASEYVYGTSLLWKTAVAIFDAAVIDSPHGLRALLDAVTGDSQPDVPAVLEHDNDELIGKEYALRARGADNAVKPLQGYQVSKPRSSEEKFPTRADMNSVRVLLVRMVDSKLCTWIDSAEDSDGTLSEVNLRQNLWNTLKAECSMPSDGPAPDCVEQWPMWRKDSLRMLLIGTDGCIGTGGRYNPQIGLLRT